MQEEKKLKEGRKVDQRWHFSKHYQLTLSHQTIAPTMTDAAETVPNTGLLPQEVAKKDVYC